MKCLLMRINPINKFSQAFLINIVLYYIFLKIKILGIVFLDGLLGILVSVFILLIISLISSQKSENNFLNKFFTLFLISLNPSFLIIAFHLIYPVSLDRSISVYTLSYVKTYFDRKELNKLDRFSAFALIAADQAINQSNILNKNISNSRVGVIVGSGIGGIGTFESQHKKLLKNPRYVSPFFIPSMISDIAAGQISIKYGFKGINYSVSSACATSNHAFGDAFKMIQSDMADVIVSGGSEAAITEMSIAGFSNMKALSKNSDKNSASRPFDRNREGFVMGEGAGILVLESYDHAKSRNAEILGEIVGYGATADAYHITSPDLNGKGGKMAMLNALSDANLDIDDIKYINAHGTSTPYNDKIESKAIKSVFKENSKKLYVTSTKSMTGHLLGAAGSIEAIASILSMKKVF